MFLSPSEKTLNLIWSYTKANSIITNKVDLDIQWALSSIIQQSFWTVCRQVQAEAVEVHKPPALDKLPVVAEGKS